MNILVVSSYLPFPLFSGGQVRLYNILKRLAKNHGITLVCEKRDYQTQNDINQVKKFCKEVYVVERKKQWSAKNVFKTGISPLSFLLVGHKNFAMYKIIDELLKKETFNLIHIETFYVMQNLPKMHLPTVLVEHNIEYLVYERFANQAPIYLKPFLLIDVMKLKRFEKLYWKKATKLVGVSTQEAALMDRSDVVIVPNGVDTTKFKAKSEKRKATKEKKILFIGDFKWVQNRDSVKWILQDIWPKFASETSYTLWIVGRYIPESLRGLTTDKNVVFDENAGDTVKIFQQPDLLLSPIRIGGGTSYKMLEAMASGVPVLTTSLGAEGLEVVANKHVLLADTTEDVVSKMTEVLSNEKLHERIAKNAREFVEERYDWKIIVQKLEEVYNSVVT